MFEEEFGARLRLLRKQAGFTQKALAKELHTSRGNISMYENGHRQPPYDLLIRMADFFHVNLDYLLGRSTNPSLQPNLSREELALMEAYRRADPNTRRIIRTILRTTPRQ